MNNNGNSKKEENWAENFINHLNKKNRWLKDKIEHWQKVILWVTDNIEETQEEKNINSWYRFNNVSYHSDKYNLPENKQDLLRQFYENPYYIFKNMVEIMWRDLISKHLRKILAKQLENDEESRLQVFVSSDSDDVFWWVDLISKLELNGRTEYMWIDIVVSANQDYLTRKSKSKTESKCIEFNLSQWLHPWYKIPRYILQFSPKLISELLDQYLSAIEKWEYVDTLELYKKIHNQNIREVRNDTNFKVNNILRI